MIFRMKNLMDLKNHWKKGSVFYMIGFIVCIRKAEKISSIPCLQSFIPLFKAADMTFLLLCYPCNSSNSAEQFRIPLTNWLINWIILGLSFLEYDNESILQTHLYFFNLHLAPCRSREKGRKSLFWILGILSSWRSARAARHPTDVIGPKIQRDDV